MNFDFLDVDRLSTIPAWVILAGVVVLLTFESGSLFGLFAPGNTVPLTLGVLVSAGVVPWSAAVPAAAVASAIGARLAFGRCRRDGSLMGLGHVEPFVPRRLLRLMAKLSTLSGSHPLVVAAAGQMFGGARTVTPRLLAATNVRGRDFAVVNAAAALVWSTALVTIGMSLWGEEWVRTALGYLWIPAVTVIAVAQLRRRTRPSSPERVGTR